MVRVRDYRIWLALVASVVLALVLIACGGGSKDGANSPGNVRLGAETASAQDVGTDATNKPNIVFILTDDQPNRMISHMDNVRTRIRDMGVNATNAYVSQSLCCPSRASIFRGQYPHNTGIEKNGPPGGGYPDFVGNGLDNNTVATNLRQAGYQTGFTGKVMNEYTCPEPMKGFSYFYGKDEPSQPGEKACENGNMIDYTGDGGNWGDRIKNKAMGFLDRNTGGTTGPFALFFWTPQPHLGAADYASRYEGINECQENLPKGPSWDEADVSDKPQWVKNLPRIGDAATSELNTLHRNQCKSSVQIDDAVGQILDKLNATNEMDNTFIVFMTDNDTAMGEHRWWSDHGAKNMAYKEGAQVMFYVRGPGVPSNVNTDELYSNNDIAPTFERIAGVTPPDYTDGRSLLTSWRNPSDPLARTALLNERGLKSAGIPVPIYKAIVTKNTTYVEYETGETEHYDHSADPDELNAAGTPSAALDAQLDALKACAGDGCTTAENQ